MQNVIEAVLNSWRDAGFNAEPRALAFSIRHVLAIKQPYTPSDWLEDALKEWRGDLFSPAEDLAGEIAVRFRRNGLYLVK